MFGVNENCAKILLKKQVFYCFRWLHLQKGTRLYTIKYSEHLPGPSKVFGAQSLPDAIPQLPSFWHPNPSCCNQEIDDEDRVKPRGFWKINQLGQRAPTQVVARFFKATLLGTMTHIPDPSGHWNEERWCSELPVKGGIWTNRSLEVCRLPKKVVFVDLFWKKKDDSFVDLTFYGMKHICFAHIHQLNIDQRRLFSLIEI